MKIFKKPIFHSHRNFPISIGKQEEKTVNVFSQKIGRFKKIMLQNFKVRLQANYF